MNAERPEPHENIDERQFVEIRDQLQAKPNRMKCLDCEIYFYFTSSDIVEYKEPEVGQMMINPKVICPNCKSKINADYDDWD